ncbi:MAG TPA: TIGR03617 family F420-dependent LLM class oxidoreductase [Rhodopila sp.]|uniref:TIGR03617 family F420-dependent LLM class oxidoreductase n=1 Tax=Rhodopila sp. TaxID=2480087 RepID=UPI002CB6D7D8|nr:TIGR03617 family F420-dependent LLM class oxidoreductase [Rhodopila sp.]HVY15207.1 TIGR03617 family F420-dependent LLM class oxidoreductase [Rhodopila sp.]
MRVSMSLPSHDWHACGTAARQAEEDGFDSVQSNEIKHDPFAPLAFAALATERVQLVTSVAIAFPRSPMIVANQAWDLHTHAKGRFVVGLGSQVKAHNERRFSVPWVAPAARLGEYVESLRAIFRCWEHKERLNYQGKYYTFSLMTPEFAPPPQGLPLPPVAVAAVGPLMLKTAARVADSVRLHSFATREYLEKVVRPLLAEELAAHGKSFEHFEITGGGFVATGPDAAAVKEALEKVRYRVAFYGSTPAYRGVFDLHGVSDLGVKLTEMSKTGQWDRMAAEIPDDVLDLFVARATYDDLPTAIEKRYGGVVDTVTIDFTPGTSTATRRDVVAAIQKIPGRFQGFRT